MPVVNYSVSTVLYWFVMTSISNSHRDIFSLSTHNEHVIEHAPTRGTSNLLLQNLTELLPR